MAHYSMADYDGADNRCDREDYDPVEDYGYADRDSERSVSDWDSFAKRCAATAESEVYA